jgi:hypothetical protein
MYDLARTSNPSDEWFSVDYSSATDGLSYNYSGRILEFLIQNLDYKSSEIARSVLGPHNLCYPSDPTVPKGQMSNGQLMGSVLSFPILCLANLGVYLLTTEIFQEDWSLKQRLRHVLINGDDMLYSAPKELWDYHVLVSGLVGLEMTVGKAYHHPVYANINSKSIHFNICDHWKSFEDSKALKACPNVIPFLNTGFFFKQSKVLGSTEKDDPFKKLSERMRSMFSDGHYVHRDVCWDKNIVTNINDLMEGSLPGKQAHLFKSFVQTNSNQLRKDCAGVCRFKGRGEYEHLFTRNMFIPLCYGGMGVQTINGIKFKIEKIQRLVAGVCRASCSLPLEPRPITGYEVESVERFKDRPWSFMRPIERDLKTCWLDIPKGNRLSRSVMVDSVRSAPNRSILIN